MKNTTLKLNVSPRTRTALLALCVAALVVHFLVAFFVFAHKPESISTTPDPLDYRLGALALLDYHQFAFAPPAFHATQLLRTPGYSFILAGTYLLDGRTGILMVVFQSLTLIAMAILLFMLLRAFDIPELISLWATAIYLFEPLQWLYTLHTMTETFSSAIVLILLVGALRGKGISSTWRAALFGLALAALLYLKPSATMWLPFLLLLICFSAGTWREWLTRIGVALLACLLAISPWVIRNHSLTGHYILSSSGPFNFVLFAGTPETTPHDFWKILTMASYNGHSHEVWYAYTADAYPMLVSTQKEILAHANIPSLVWRQFLGAPAVWFGHIRIQNEESYGHSYSLLADLALGHHAALDRIINVLDTAIWSVVLLLSIAGSYLLLRSQELRWKFLPLLAMLLGSIFINFQASWARMLLPVYPAIFLASAAAITYGMKYLRRTPSV